MNNLWDEGRMKTFLQQLKNCREIIIKQTHDTGSVFRNSPHKAYELSTFEAHPESPTAQRYLKAFRVFSLGRNKLDLYANDKVETFQDCEDLQPVFHSYAIGYMYENHLYDSFRPPENIVTLIDQYLKLRPDDILTQYFKVIFFTKVDSVINKSGNMLSDFKKYKTIIVNAEEFAHKLVNLKDKSDIKKQILIHLYYSLGAIYASTHQTKRALDSFQKSFDLDNRNYSALFGVAYHHYIRDKDPVKAISLFLKYTDMAPVCDKQYHDAYYSLAVIQAKHYRNKGEALRYYNLGQEAEEKQLPFLQVDETFSKRLIKMLFAI